MEVRPYRSEDLALMPPRGCEQSAAKLEEELAFINVLRLANPSFTLVANDGQPIVAAGIIVYRPGRGEGWLRGSTRMLEHPLKCARELRTRFKLIREEHKLWRVQATIRAEYDKGIWFARWLGFSAEGVLRKAGEDGQDMIMMAWVEE